MAKKEANLFEQIKDIFSENGEDYNPTDEEMLSSLSDPRSEENISPGKKAVFVAKLYTRMKESEEFERQVSEIVNRRIEKKSEQSLTLSL